MHTRRMCDLHRLEGARRLLFEFSHPNNLCSNKRYSDGYKRDDQKSLWEKVTENVTETIICQN
jgi:hypothetical protein